VIAYNDCTDGSEEIILDFCKKNPGFIPARFDDFNKFPNEKWGSRITRLYNFALSFIPKNEWLVKIDADHVYAADKLKKSFSLPQFEDDIVVLPKIQLHWDGKELSFLKNRPFSFSRDHYLIFNDESLHFFTMLRNVERIDRDTRRCITAEFTNWHFPVKFTRTQQTERACSRYSYSLVLFDEFMETFDGRPFDFKPNWLRKITWLRWRIKRKKKIIAESMDMKMLDKDFIMSYVRQFVFGD
jgi:hypothetical protein